jgi:hypothetical protein
VASAPAPPGLAFVVHGEPGPAQALRAALAERLELPAVVARHGERVCIERGP